MKKSALLILLLLLSFVQGFSQDKMRIITYWDLNQTIPKESYHILNKDSSLVDGNYFKFSLYGDTIVQGTFLRGEKEGVFTNYFENGKIQRTTYYKENLRQGVTKVYADYVKILLVVF